MPARFGYFKPTGGHDVALWRIVVDVDHDDASWALEFDTVITQLSYLLVVELSDRQRSAKAVVPLLEVHRPSARPGHKLVVGGECVGIFLARRWDHRCWISAVDKNCGHQVRERGFGVVR